MEKFKPFKSCSCRLCKLGKTPKNTKPHERKFRRKSKISLKINAFEFANEPLATGYFD